MTSDPKSSRKITYAILLVIAAFLLLASLYFNLVYKREGFHSDDLGSAHFGSQWLLKNFSAITIEGKYKAADTLDKRIPEKEFAQIALETCTEIFTEGMVAKSLLLSHVPITTASDPYSFRPHPLALRIIFSVTPQKVENHLNPEDSSFILNYRFSRSNMGALYAAKSDVNFNIDERTHDPGALATYEIPNDKDQPVSGFYEQFFLTGTEIQLRQNLKKSLANYCNYIKSDLETNLRDTLAAEKVILLKLETEQKSESSK